MTLMFLPLLTGFLLSLLPFSSPELISSGGDWQGGVFVWEEFLVTYYALDQGERSFALSVAMDHQAVLQERVAPSTLVVSCGDVDKFYEGYLTVEEVDQVEKERVSEVVVSAFCEKHKEEFPDSPLYK